MEAKATIGKDVWQQKLEKANVSKEALNQLVMNYLVIEGYKDVAQAFRSEAQVETDMEPELIEERMKVRAAVQNGDILTAIELVNDLDPEILDTNPLLFFHLQQQRMIELIREGRTEDALNFAQEELAPRGEENSGFLEELEATMGLLAFEDAHSCPTAHLLGSGQRQKIASELNAAILGSQSQEKDPKLVSLIKMLAWTQGRLKEKVSFPKLTNVVASTFETSEDEE
jgi:hypothetical protein